MKLMLTCIYGLYTDYPETFSNFMSVHVINGCLPCSDASVYQWFAFGVPVQREESCGEVLELRHPVGLPYFEWSVQSLPQNDIENENNVFIQLVKNEEGCFKDPLSGHNHSQHLRRLSVCSMLKERLISVATVTLSTLYILS